MRIFMLIGIMCALFGLEANAQSKLTVKFTNLNDKGGKIYLIAFDSAETYMKQGMRYILDVKGEETTSEINIPDGEYAIITYQDENGNGELDRGMFGIPKEKYGFSNNAKLVMGPPSFDKCKFTVKGDTKIEIDMR